MNQNAKSADHGKLREETSNVKEKGKEYMGKAEDKAQDYKDYAKEKLNDSS